MKKIPYSFTILSLCVTLSGCGTAEYEERLERGVTSMSSGSKFNSDLNPETTVAGTQVSLRIPKAMQSVDLNDPAGRGKCPLLELPSLKAAYEGFVEDSDKNKMHYYLYVSVGEAANNFIPTLDWLNKLKGTFPNAGDDSSAAVNKDYAAATPQGDSVRWEEIHVKGPQRFYYTKPDGSQINQDIPGTIVCLNRMENGVLVSLIFRYPSALDDRHSTDFDSDWIKLVAGCAKIGAPGG
ncbi:MAG: hypothetical protein IT426_20700 [Pirellulales bacterium]|nr:hypothetical protein [Pirellulales bacterium]